MKRFCETTRFDQDFYSSLPVTMKVAYDFVFAKCDNAGVWLPNFRLSNFQIGADVDWYKFQERMEKAGELTVLPTGAWLLWGFIPLQYGHDLKESVNAHKAVFTALKKHGLSWDGHGIVVPPRWDQKKNQDQNQDQDQDRKEVQEETITPTLEQVIAYGTSPQGNVPEEMCRLWWDTHEARPRHASGRYLDKNNMPIMDWKASLRAYRGNWVANSHQRNGRGVTPTTKPIDYTNGF